MLQLLLNLSAGVYEGVNKTHCKAPRSRNLYIMFRSVPQSWEMHFVAQGKLSGTDVCANGNVLQSGTPLQTTGVDVRKAVGSNRRTQCLILNAHQTCCHSNQVTEQVIADGRPESKQTCRTSIVCFRVTTATAYCFRRTNLVCGDCSLFRPRVASGTTLQSLLFFTHRRDHSWPPCERSHFSSAFWRIPWRIFGMTNSSRPLLGLELASCLPGRSSLVRRGFRADRSRGTRRSSGQLRPWAG